MKRAARICGFAALIAYGQALGVWIGYSALAYLGYAAAFTLAAAVLALTTGGSAASEGSA